MIPRRQERVRAKLAPWLAFGLALCCGTSALAHPELERAKRLAAELELEPALGAFARALESGTLTRAELIALLAERALVLHALQRRDELVHDFIWLSALAPDQRLDLRAPPELIALWTSVRDQGRGPLAIELEAQASAEGWLTARSSLTGTVPQGARARLVLRRADGAFRALDRAELRAPLGPGSEVELYAQVLGLGEVVVAEAYSAERPLGITGLAPSAAPARRERRSWIRRQRGWLIGGAALAASLAIASVLIARAAADDDRDATRVMPMVDF